MNSIIIFSVVLVSLVGLFIGVFLGVFSEVFKVEVDEKVAKIRECLPGNNCGGCGYPGCDGMAEAIAKGTAPVNACPVGGPPVANKIAEVLGTTVGETEKKVAFVHCDGSCVKSVKAYEYTGIKKCSIASSLPNKGEKKCTYACIGYGECVDACKFDAIHIIDGVAVVDKEKCVACGRCVAICPMHVIELVPYKNKQHIHCSNHDKGKPAMDVCTVSCIACGMCAKNCPSTAIEMINDLPVIDYEKCTLCGTCAEKCPRHCITKQ